MSTRPSPLDREGAKFSTGKLSLMQYLCLAVLAYLVSGFWQLQIQDPVSTANWPSGTASSRCR